MKKQFIFTQFLINIFRASFHFFLGEALARWVALFNARGPPATR